MKQWMFSVEKLVRDGRIFLLYMTPHSPCSIVIFGEDHERNQGWLEGLIDIIF